MNLSDIITKCYILALIIRDDGERLLLGDGFYEFKENLQHFQPNTFVNDVVELQGTDGQLLAGQVRRTAVQTFEGFIADGTIGREQTETNRRRFLQFFRKKHFYTVVYILPDGSAVQRDRGYIVNAPSVPELYQRFPEYSVGLNFEDPNYYEYDEGEDGEEIPAHSVVLSIANLLEGGLIWDAFGAVSNEKTWLDWENGTTTAGFYTYSNGLAGAPLEFTQLDGNATQQTYTGKNLLNVPASYVCTGVQTTNMTLSAGTYTLSFASASSTGQGQSSYFRLYNDGGTDLAQATISYSTKKLTFTITGTTTKIGIYSQNTWSGSQGVTTTFTELMVEKNDHQTSYEKFVGGAPSPNPDFPQVVNTVTGGQTVLITGKNIFDKNMTTTPGMISDTGVIGGSAGTYHTSDFIPIGPNTSYVYSGAVNIGGSPARCYYDANKNFISGVKHDSQNPFINTSPANARYMRESIDIGNISSLMIEAGTQASQYEPFQSNSYAINLGKNLLPFTNQDFTISHTTFKAVNGNLVLDGNETSEISSANATFKTNFAFTLDIGTYTLSMPANTGIAYIRKLSDASEIANVNGANVKTRTFTLTEQTEVFLGFYIYHQNFNNTPTNVMLERGAAATTFFPYKTPVELAGVGPIQPDGLPQYHDSFKRVDGVWYKHAEIGKVASVDFSRGSAPSGGGMRYYTPNDYGGKSAPQQVLTMSSHFIGCSHADRSVALNTAYVNGNIGVSMDTTMTLNQFKTWFANNSVALYYALATPTDTAITDADLLAQLNAIASTFDGVNNITITPSAGAQGELSVHYATGSIDVGAGYEWEEGSDSGTNIIVNNGIDSVNPTWIVPGPATNPTLTNITTGQTIVWEGSVASGQTLTVDLNRQTAELGGTNVFAQLSGDWVKLAPGPNKLAYSATGATEGCRLEWNGVVG